MSDSGLPPPRGRAAGALLRSLLAPEQNTRPRLSPDARQVAYVEAVDGREHVRLVSVAEDDPGRGRGLAQDGGEHDRVLPLPRGAAVQDLRWTHDGSHLICQCTARVTTGSVLIILRRDVFKPIALPKPLVTREFWVADRRGELLVNAAGAGDGERAALHRVCLLEGTVEPVALAAPPGHHRWLVDGDLRVRGCTTLAEDGSLSVLLGDHFPDAVERVCTIERDTAPDFAFEGFDRGGSQAFLLSSHDAPTRRLLRVDCATGVLATVFEDPLHDVDGYPIAGNGVYVDPRTGEPDICSVIGQRIRYHPLTDAAAARLAALTDDPDDPLVLVDRSAGDDLWVTVRTNTDGPIEYRLTPVAARKDRTLFVNRPALLRERLPRLRDFRFRARDGLELAGYTLRPLDTEGPQPGIVLVHGGPASRDYWRFHAVAHYFATLGFASLHVNYRGSRGNGRAFRAAGNGEWGGAMQDDLYDGVSEAVRRRLFDPEAVLLYGSSYGGYAALIGACTRPDLVRGAIAVSPPCDLVRFACQPPPYWRPLAPVLQHQILGPGRSIERDAGWLERRSPRHRLTEACAPLLVAHGVHDPRVPVQEVDAFIERARGLSVRVRYERFEDEGHEVRILHNRIRLFDAVENFIAELLEVSRGHRDARPANALHAR